MRTKADISSALALWEDTEAQMASLTSSQRSILSQMTDEALFGGSAIGENAEVVLDDTSSAKSGQHAKVKTTTSDSWKAGSEVAKPTKLDNGRDFLDWLDRMETSIQTEKSSHFYSYYDRISELSDQTNALLEQVDKGLEVLDFLSEQNLSASTKSNNLHSVCNDLMKNMSSLNDLKDEIEAKENVFKDADKAVAQSNHILNADNVCKLLDEIDQCLRFFKEHHNYKDAGKYEVKCRAAASKVLVFIKDFFKSAGHFDQAAANIPHADSAASFDLFYGRLKTMAPRFNRIMTHLAQCPDDSPLKEELDSTLQDSVNIFISSRQRLVIQSLDFTLQDSMKKFERDHCSLVRSASVSLYHLLKDEEALLAEFFPIFTQSAEDYFSSICSIFYDSLRPKIVKLHHLETLSEIASILKLELMEHSSGPAKTNASQAFNTSITQLWQDVQERLVYRAYIFIKTDIQDFSPHEGDLLYPEKLQMMLAIAEDSAIKDSPADIHGMWYPTVRRTLMCLSKLYRSVEKDIFQEVSHEALKACIQSIVFAANQIESRKSKFDGQLFLIKHLLILREQITPFNIIQSSSETALDFSHMRNVLSPTQRSFDQFLRNSLPEVREFQMDYRKEVDRLLKLTCEKFIHDAAHGVIGSIFSVIKDATELKKHAASVLNEKVTEAMRSMKKVVPIVQQKMSLYLANRETEFILYKPIRVSILEAFSRFSKMVEENFDEQDLVVIGCPNIDGVSVTLSSLSMNSASKQ